MDDEFDFDFDVENLDLDWLDAMEFAERAYDRDAVAYAEN